MKPAYKKIFLWSSIGSVAVGAAVTFARRPRRPALRPLACRRIPRDCKEAVLWTERFDVETEGTRRFAHDQYRLQSTPFKVWNVLDLKPQGGSVAAAAQGAAIYHVSQVRFSDGEEREEGREEEQLLERFYGVVTVVDDSGRACPQNAVARGGFLEIRKCYVGGSSNGVESGEVHRSQARLLNYRFDYPNSVDSTATEPD